MDSARPPHVGFVLEQTLGHVTHSDNLLSIVSASQAVRPVWCPVEFPVVGAASRVPVYRSNWTVRAGIRARRSVRRAQREGQLDALFVHTQVPAVLLGRWMRRIPTVVSLDATPKQYDELGLAYNHEVGGRGVERAKQLLNIRCLRTAKQIVTWSAWAKAGLVAEYGVEPTHVHVIPPGVWCERWIAAPAGARTRDADAIVRILFVGGDLQRKGGDVLLAAFEQLRVEHGPQVELHLVTKSPVPPSPGVHRHGEMSPNSDELKALYHLCDIFCLPTRADCLPMVLSEAGAAGLPLVSTAVGAIPEIVRDLQTGLIVPPGEVDPLADALSVLVTDSQRRTRLGDAARALVRERYDAAKNATAILELLLDLCGARR